jgi:BirA family biotin operon repressor/biotin-[acetyl-CoA-carboxylase] ligase
MTGSNTHSTTFGVIAQLRSGTVLSGQILAKRLGVSRAAVHKAVQTLRHGGFDVKGTAGAGYTLCAVPDLLCEEAVVPALPADTFGCAGWVHHASTESTNGLAAQLARQGAPHGTVVVAEHQTGGRGRRGRSFVSPPGTGIYMSVVLRPTLGPQEAYRLTLCGAHAVLDCCRALGLPALLKWPNDVTVGNRKLCGVLTELSADAERIHQAVLGVGVNVRTRRDAFPAELRSLVTSVEDEAGRTVDRVLFCQELLKALTRWYAVTLTDFPRVVARAREVSATLGRTVKVHDAAHPWFGTAEGLDDDGALVLKTADGARRVVAGDVEFV